VRSGFSSLEPSVSISVPATKLGPASWAPTDGQPTSALAARIVQLPLARDPSLMARCVSSIGFYRTFLFVASPESFQSLPPESTRHRFRTAGGSFPNDWKTRGLTSRRRCLDTLSSVARALNQRAPQQHRPIVVDLAVRVSVPLVPCRGSEAIRMKLAVSTCAFASPGTCSDVRCQARIGTGLTAVRTTLVAFLYGPPRS
jgi:hypothetical protein